MYEDQTDLIIKNRMLKDIPSTVNSGEGSFINDVLAPTSQEFSQTYGVLGEILKRVFAITAAKYGYSNELELKAAEFGIYRKVGTAASGIVTFYGTDGIIIPKGTLVQTLAGLQFKTTEEKAINNGSRNIHIEAAEIGKKYNVPSNTVIQLPVQMLGVVSISNVDPITGGTESETDDAMLSRLLLKAQAPAVSGNANHYKMWATEIPGVGDAKVFPLWAGPGTVKVCIIDANKLPANSTLIDAVSKHIDENRPIGAAITVSSAQQLIINVNATTVRNPNFTIDQVKLNFQNKVSEYLKTIAFKQAYLSYAQIGSCLLASEGIDDYNNLLVNGSAANVLIGNEQIAVLGGVVFNE